MKKRELLTRIEALEARVAYLEMMRYSPQQPWDGWRVTYGPASGIRPGMLENTSGTRIEQRLES